jgi:hypothetical protein
VQRLSDSASKLGERQNKALHTQLATGDAL